MFVYRIVDKDTDEILKEKCTEDVLSSEELVMMIEDVEAKTNRQVLWEFHNNFRKDNPYDR